jgi:hypothetical protein
MYPSTDLVTRAYVSAQIEAHGKVRKDFDHASVARISDLICEGGVKLASYRDWSRIILALGQDFTDIDEATASSCASYIESLGLGTRYNALLETARYRQRQAIMVVPSEEVFDPGPRIAHSFEKALVLDRVRRSFDNPPEERQ